MATKKVRPPQGLKAITQEELDLMLKRYKKFVLTKGRAGSTEDFTGYDFTGLSFRSSYLTGADFRGSWLDGVDLSNSVVKNCNFEDCWVENSYSKNVNFASANIKGTLWAIP